jgi:hypothetical protein
LVCIALTPEKKFVNNGTLGGSLKGEAFGDAFSKGGHPQAALEAATPL